MHSSYSVKYLASIIMSTFWKRYRNVCLCTGHLWRFDWIWGMPKRWTRVAIKLTRLSFVRQINFLCLKLILLSCRNQEQSNLINSIDSFGNAWDGECSCVPLPYDILFLLRPLMRNCNYSKSTHHNFVMNILIAVTGRPVTRMSCICGYAT